MQSLHGSYTTDTDDDILMDDEPGSYSQYHGSPIFVDALDTLDEAEYTIDDEGGEQVEEEDVEEEADDGDELRRLMEMHEGMRRAELDPPDAPEEVDAHGRSTSPNDLSNVEERVEPNEAKYSPLHLAHRSRGADVRDQAQAYLESLFLNLLREILSSAKYLNKRDKEKEEKARKRRERASAVSRRRRGVVDEQDSPDSPPPVEAGEDEEILNTIDDDAEEVNDGPEEEAEEEEEEPSFGISLATMNRKTGGEQRLKWPVRPIAKDTKKRETTLDKMGLYMVNL